MTIRLGTRGSKLALAQTRLVMEQLKKAYPEYTYEIVVIKTKGDKILDKPLDRIGDKGLFVKEIEEKLLQGQIDLGVHSMKDMPTDLAEGLTFAKTWKREDPRDVLILREAKSLKELPKNAVIATGSKRRIAQLRQMREDLIFVGIRGNIDTRLRKMEEEKLDGIVLAAAGLHRLGLKERITEYLDPEQMIPAAAQGALALELRADNIEWKAMVDRLSDPDDHACILTEREFLQAVGGNCQIPVGALCIKNGMLYDFMAAIGENEEESLARIRLQGTDPILLGRQVAEEVKRGQKHG